MGAAGGVMRQWGAASERRCGLQELVGLGVGMRILLEHFCDRMQNVREGCRGLGGIVGVW